MFKRLIVVLVVALIPTFAAADWQYVKWGMTKKAAVDASKGEATMLRGGEDVVCGSNSEAPFAVIPRKTIGEFVFQVTFCTEGDATKITSVVLSPVSGTNLPTLSRALVSQYGQPTKAGGSFIWSDKKSGNVVSYYELGGVVGRIEYKKLGATGL